MPILSIFASSEFQLHTSSQSKPHGHYTAKTFHFGGRYLLGIYRNCQLMFPYWQCESYKMFLNSWIKLLAEILSID